MSATACDSQALFAWTGFSPATPLREGVQRFANWFIQHYPTP
jgi:UDP-glucuronate 4-epimerase